jgi:CheY-like chemotaxis protein
MLDCEVQGYLAKPFDAMEVLQQVQAHLNEAAAPALSDPVAALPSKTILIADDYVLYRKKMALILQDAGFNVIEADNGAMALKQARERRPDLILMDVVMPVMDGLDATQQIRRDAALRQVPIIMLTTSVRMKDVPVALAYGADAYIAKPQTAEQLIEKVRACLA